MTTPPYSLIREFSAPNSTRAPLPVTLPAGTASHGATGALEVTIQRGTQAPGGRRVELRTHNSVAPAGGTDSDSGWPAIWTPLRRGGPGPQAPSGKWQPKNTHTHTHTRRPLERNRTAGRGPGPDQEIPGPPNRDPDSRFRPNRESGIPCFPIPAESGSESPDFPKNPGNRGNRESDFLSDEYQLQWTRNILSREYHARGIMPVPVLSQAVCGSYSGSETVRGNMLL